MPLQCPAKMPCCQLGCCKFAAPMSSCMLLLFRCGSLVDAKMPHVANKYSANDVLHERSTSKHVRWHIKHCTAQCCSSVLSAQMKAVHDSPTASAGVRCTQEPLAVELLPAGVSTLPLTFGKQVSSRQAIVWMLSMQQHMIQSPKVQTVIQQQQCGATGIVISA